MQIVKNIDNKIRIAKLIKKKEIAEKTHEFTFELEQKMDFLPGQYIWIELLHLSKSDPKGNRRPFSPANIQNVTNNVTIIFRSTKSEFNKSLRALKIGGKIVMTGPFGSSFCLPENPTTPLILIAGGTGMTPFLSLIRYSTHINSRREITLININDSKKKTFYIDELEGYQQNFRSFRMIQLNRKIHFKDIKDIPNFNHTLIYICGPQGFIDHVHNALKSHEISDNQFRFECCYPSSRISYEIEKLYKNGRPKINLYKSKSIRQHFELVYKLIHSSASHTIVTDINGTILFANRVAEETTEFTLQEMLGNTPRLWGGMMTKQFYEKMWNLKLDGKIFKGEVINRKKSGKLYISSIHIAPIFGEDKKIIGFLSTEEDVTKEKTIDREKTEFVSLASHQLKTPVGAMRWNLEMLMDGDYGQLSSKQKDVIKEIFGMNIRMNELINRLLNISRIELGTFIIEPSPTDFAVVCNEVLSEIEWEIAKKNHTLIKNINEKLPIIPADPKLLRMIFQNLLSNAIKFTQQSGKITITLDSDKRCIIFRVANNGAPIPQEDQSRIFEKLFRANNAQEQDPGGSGLGLYLVKQIVDNSGGKIWFTSKKGKDTIFSVSFPLSGMIKKKAQEV